LGQNDEDDLGISYAAVDLMLLLLDEKKIERQKVVHKYFYPSEVVGVVLSRVESNRFKNKMPPLLEIKIEKKLSTKMT